MIKASRSFSEFRLSVCDSRELYIQFFKFRSQYQSEQRWLTNHAVVLLLLSVLIIYDRYIYEVSELIKTVSLTFECVYVMLS